MERIQAGHYRQRINGNEVQIINHRIYGSNRTNKWNVVINGECNEYFFSKKEAMQYAKKQK
jgi:hypothetical protein